MTAINGNYINYQDWLNTDGTSQTSSNDDLTVFSVGGGEESVEALEDTFESVSDEQGIIGKLWNGFKNLTGLGLGSNDVKDSIEQYENGEITYEEALETIESYETKQDGAVEIAANAISGVITGVVAIGTLGTGLAGGAVIGGAVKTAVKTLDRATNEVDGDAIDAKEMAKDFVTGAVDGAVSVATAGMFEATGAVSSLKEAVIDGVKTGVKSGTITGAVTGAADYTVEAIAEEDVDFTLQGLASTTLQNAVAGGVMGGVIGGVTGGISYTKGSTTASIISDKNNWQGDVQDIDSFVDAETGIRYTWDEAINGYVETVDDIVEEAADKVIEEAADTAADITAIAADEVVDETAEKVAGKAADEVIEEAADTAADITAIAADEVVDETAEKVAGKAADEVIEEAADTAADITAIAADEVVDETAEKIAGEAADEVIEEAADTAAAASDDIIENTAALDTEISASVESQYVSKVEELRQSALSVENKQFTFPDGSSSEFEIYTGTRAGSNDGYYALDKQSGTLYYAKISDDVDRAASEVAASKLYNLAGVDTPELSLITTSDGQTGIISKYITDLDTVYSSNSTVGNGYAADAYLANWDAVRSGNTAMSGDSAVRVDVGGSLDYRAQGALKTNFDGTVDEIVTMYGNNSYIYGDMTKDQLVSSLEKVVNMSDDEITAVLEETGMTRYSDVLIQRKEYLAEYLETLKNSSDDGSDMLTMLKNVQAETNSSIAAADTAADVTVRTAGDTVEEASETTAIQSIDDLADDALVQTADKIGGEQTSSLQSLIDDYKRGWDEIHSQYIEEIRAEGEKNFNAAIYRYSDEYFDKILDEHMADIDAIVLDENGNIRSVWCMNDNFGKFEEVLQPYEGESPVLYHATSGTSAESIRSEGFDLARPPVHGHRDGIGGAYFTLEETSGSYGNSTITAKCSGNLAQADTDILQNIKVAMSANFDSEFGSLYGNSETLMQKYMQKKAISLGYSGVVGTNSSARASYRYVSIFDKDAIQIIS